MQSLLTPLLVQSFIIARSTLRARKFVTAAIFSNPVSGNFSAWAHYSRRRKMIFLKHKTEGMEPGGSRSPARPFLKIVVLCLIMLPTLGNLPWDTLQGMTITLLGTVFHSGFIPGQSSGAPRRTGRFRR
jgi:hypothetical protein